MLFSCHQARLKVNILLLAPGRCCLPETPPDPWSDFLAIPSKDNVKIKKKEKKLKKRKCRLHLNNTNSVQEHTRVGNNCEQSSLVSPGFNWSP